MTTETSQEPKPVPAPDEAVRGYLRQIGSKGGSSGRGRAKARTPGQARRAAKARWKKYYESKRPGLKPPAPSPEAGEPPQG